MPNPNILSPRIDEAIRVATYAHRNQVRKSTEIPYIVHPYAVMTIASSETDDEDVLIACLLHDVLEDAPEELSREEMEERFGKRVLAIVSGVTKDSTIKGWRERSEAYIDHLRQAPIESVIVSAADKIHNLQSILTDYATHGEHLWDRFNAGKHEQLWWYTSILEVLEERLPDSILTSQLAHFVDEMQGIVSNQQE